MIQQGSSQAEETKLVPGVRGLSEAKQRLLARRLAGLGSPSHDVDSIKPRVEGRTVPISAEQQRIWLHSSTHADLPLYNEPITIHRRGSFDLATFEASFNEILRRHEAWRASFSVVEQAFVQVIHPVLTISLPFSDLSTLSPQQRENEAQRLATADAQAPIPLDGAPLFRARVVRMAEDEHRLYLTLHHIIFDGVSIYRVLMPELAAIYADLESGRPVSLPKPALQYGDYAVWRQGHVASASVTRHLDFWRRQLAGELPVLRLPVDRPRPARISHKGSMECFEIPAELIATLRGFSTRQGVTLYIALLAAFKALLFRYGGQEDVIVGGAADARRRPELENLMGYFLDTFAVRTHPRANMLFTDYLLDVRTSFLDALAAADVPFDQVVQVVQPRRDASHHPVFQAFFSIEPPAAPIADGWDLTQMDVVVGTSKFDLYLELDERPSHMAARFMYNTDIFDAATIKRMIEHWLVILHEVCNQREHVLGELPILTAAEIAAMAGPGGWNDTRAPLPKLTLPELVGEQARRRPSAQAVRFAHSGKQCWTYSELMARVNWLKSALQSEGVKPGDVVAVLMPRSLNLPASLLAVLAAGAVYLPLDVEMPASRIAACLASAHVTAILTERELRAHFGESETPLLLIEDLQGTAESHLPSEPPALGDLAYLICTSGTTGLPKTVEITHASLVNLLTSMQQRPGFQPTDTLLAVTTVSFDIAALELFLPLLAGGCLVIAESETARDPYLLSAAIETSGCNVMQATPATWRSLLTAGWHAPARGLKVLCGGEQLPRELAERLLNENVELWNLYGPTETTIWSLVDRVSHGTGPVPIGHPVANTTAYVLDERKHLLPVNASGELYIGGVGVAQGYRGMPALTEERFLPSVVVAGDRLYRTGDLAVRRANGAMECMGRTDHQVKVRGFRVELEGVESAVLRHPQVAAAAACTWPDEIAGTRLSVYLVGRDGAPPTLDTLRRFLKQDLPDFMIPIDAIPLAAIPMTLNGKIDRGRLPSPPSIGVLIEGNKPTTDTARQLAAIWRDLLHIEQAGMHDDFFDLGGHSLLVPLLLERIVLVFGQRIPMAAIFNAATLEQQSALIERNLRSDRMVAGLIPLQLEGALPPLFWLDPPSGIVNLTQALGKDRPVLGVVLSQEDVKAVESSPSIERIAARHVQTIVNAQPSGPYLLGGFCTGGIVAFETAVQLRKAGREVALLILIDTQNPVLYKRVDSLPVELSKLAFYLKQILSQNSTCKEAWRRLRSRLSKLARPAQFTDEMYGTDQITESSAYRYQPTDYAGDVLYLDPKDRPTRKNHVPGWRPCISGMLHVETVNGNHEDLFSPDCVGGLAQIVAQHLALASSQAAEDPPHNR